MFKKEYQGGDSVEVFSAQGRDPVQHWRLTGSVKKDFDKSLRGYVYVLEGGTSTTTTRMALPKSDKTTLGLNQACCVLQLYVPDSVKLAVELSVVDTAGNRRRLHLSTSQREVNATPLNARIPLVGVLVGSWMNLCIGVSDLVKGLFKGVTYKSLEGIALGGSCRLRRIFTLKATPTGLDVLEIPQAYHVSSSSLHTIVVDHNTIRQRTEESGISENVPHPPSDPRPTHVAFGQKVPIPQHLFSRQSRGEGHSRGGLEKPVPPSTLADQTVLKVQRARVRMVAGKGSSRSKTRGQHQTSSSEREQRTSTRGLGNGNQKQAGSENQKQAGSENQKLAGSELEWNKDQHYSLDEVEEGAAQRPGKGRGHRSNEAKNEARHILSQDEELAVAVLRPPTEELVTTHKRRGSGKPTGLRSVDKSQGEGNVKDEHQGEGNVKDKDQVEDKGQNREDTGQYLQSVEDIGLFVETVNKGLYDYVEDKGQADEAVEWVEEEEVTGTGGHGDKRHVYSYRSAPKSAEITRTSSGEASRGTSGTRVTSGSGTRVTSGNGTRVTSGSDTRVTSGSGTKETSGSDTRETSGRGTRVTSGSGTRETSDTNGTRKTSGSGTRRTNDNGTRKTSGSGISGTRETSGSGTGLIGDTSSITCGRTASERDATLDQDFLMPRDCPSQGGSSSSGSPFPEDPVAMATRLSDDYDWRQYVSRDEDHGFHGNDLSLRTRLAGAQQHPPSNHTHQSIALEDTLTESMTLSGVTEQFRTIRHSPFMDSLDTRAMGGMLSPVPVESMESLEPGLQGKDVEERAGQLGEKETDELELMYDPQLNCFYDPNTCKYYELVQP